MRDRAPFDVWDGEDTGTTEEEALDAAEEVAMHVDPESEPEGEAETGAPGRWSDLVDPEVDRARSAPVRYFADEQPERDADEAGEEHEPTLTEILRRQHY